MRRLKDIAVIRIASSLILLYIALLSAAASDLTRAEELYQTTEYSKSLALLDKNGPDGPTNFLAGRNYLMLGESKKASEALEKATTAEPGNSEYMDWLGKAYGRRAESANPFLAPGLASKTRQAFEKAVELNAKNRDALSDLFDYYLEAPGFLGGGYSKAAAIAEKMSALDRTQALNARARLAEKQKDFGAAEQLLRKAIAVDPGKPGPITNLAKFLAKQGRSSESDALFTKAENAAANAPDVWFEHAHTLIQQKRHPDLAKALLQRYIGFPLTPNHPSREEAVKLLKQAGGG